jgi:hypothetical protein
LTRELLLDERIDLTGACWCAAREASAGTTG